MNKIFTWIKNNISNIILGALLCGLIYFRISENISYSYKDGYRQGQIDIQKGIVIWKVEAGQVWELKPDNK